MEILPEDDPAAAQLFERYLLNDPIPLYDEQSRSSGYNPFYDLLHAPVPEKWKVLADAEIREIILAEAAGDVQPRCDWEKALGCYAAHISPRSDQARYSPTLLASQVTFLLETAPKDHPIIQGFRLKNFLVLLEGEEYKELRHLLARRAVFEPYPFHIFDDSTRETAEMMLVEFGDDGELIAQLHHLISEYDEHYQKREREQKAQKLRLGAILEKMR